MMRTAILVMVAAVALSAVAMPAQAESGCVSREVVGHEVEVCYRLDDDCRAVGVYVRPGTWVETVCH